MNATAYEGSTMKKLKYWKIIMLVLVVIHCMIYFDQLVFFSSAAADANQTLADHRAAAGFISIDCGMIADSRYDSDAGLHYSSDVGFIDTGIQNRVKVKFNQSESLYNTLRSFPEGKRNCYTLKPLQRKNNNYLIRVYFLYGNYDEKSSIPQFQLFIDVNYWKEVQPRIFGSRFFVELIYNPPRDYIHVCLLNIELGVPFISGLELKPLNNSIYKSTTRALGRWLRFDPGSTSTSDVYYSLIDDPYDRKWAVVPKTSAVWGSLRSKESMKTAITTDAYKLPPSVLKTAAIPVHDTGSLDFSYNGLNNNYEVQVYWHFAEIQKLGINDSREFTISMNGKPLPGKISPKYMQVTTIVSPATIIDGNSLVFNITRTTKSTLPPILNALEICAVLPLPNSATYQDDVNAIMNVKMHYTVPKGWQGDPCRPASAWNGLNCSQDGDNHSPRITSLNLAGNGLVGDIPGSLSKLTSLACLNLSYNSLTGVIPDFLADLPSLRTLDLKSNKLTGRVPTALSKKVEEGSLYLSLEDNPDLCSSCKKKNWKKIGTILAAAVVSIILIVTATAAVCKYKQKKPAGNILGTSVKSGSERFTHFDVINMTNNFQNVIGSGGSGIVYYGCLQDGNPVAVKMLNPSCALSLRLFSTEAELLTRVHHRNLVSLKGYCEEGQIMALIYEYVVNGNLQQHLSEKNAKVLCWKERLQIATEAAQGLEYLHSGCTPSIVHRDLKTSNILLDENFHAKISDFGISKAFSTESIESAIVTKVMGTHGYLDPEYYITQRLQKKSDVYSFGVVLLELITGHPSIIRSSAEPIHVVAWTTPKFESGDIDNIVDVRLQRHFNTNSAWKALEIAMGCVSATGIQRPSMNQVLIDLRDCLAIEIDHQITRHIGNYESGHQPVLIVNDDIVIDDSSIEMGPNPR